MDPCYSSLNTIVSLSSEVFRLEVEHGICASLPKVYTFFQLCPCQTCDIMQLLKECCQTDIQRKVDFTEGKVIKIVVQVRQGLLRN